MNGWWANMMGWYGNGGWWSFGMVFMGLFWVALIVGAIWAVSRFARRPDDVGLGGMESARQLLDRRFASGQIDAEQYAEARRVLEGRSVDKAQG